MEKIKLSSGIELNIITCGIACSDESMTVNFLPEGKNLTELEAIVTNGAERIVLLSETGEELRIWNGYTILNAIGLENDVLISMDEDGKETVGKVVTITLKKTNEILTRLSSVESQITDTQMALCEIYEGMV